MEKYKELIFKVGIFVVVVLLFLYLRQFFTTSGVTEKDTVAIVNNEKITKRELTDRLISMFGKDALDRLIEEKLVIQEANKKKIKVKKEEIDAALDNLKSSYRSRKEFEKAIKDALLTEEKIRNQLEIGLMLNHLVGKTVTEEEMKAHYEQYKDRYIIQKGVFCRHILVKTEEAANTIYDKLKKGANFEEIAIKESIDDLTKDRGGAIGWLTEGSSQYGKEFEKVAFSLEVGQISPPVKTQSGYHIIKVEQKRSDQQLTFEEAKEQIKKRVIDMKTLSYIEELKSKSKIKNLLFGE